MSDSKTLRNLLLGLTALLSAMLVLMVGALAWLLGGLSLAPLSRAFGSLFALDSVQGLWYVTRAAGLIAYLLLWLSTVWGLAVSSKIFDPLLHRAFTYDMHQFISLLAIGFTVLHVAVLVGDKYLPFTLAQILIPFIDPYRPLWVGIGVIGLYLTLLVTVTFYLRRWIGQKTFRAIHLFSFLGYAGVTVHGLMAGTDSVLPSVQIMYAGTALVVIFLTIFWYLMRQGSSRSAAPAPLPERHDPFGGTRRISGNS